MSTVGCIQFIRPELSQSPSATIVQQDWTDVSIVELHFEGEIHMPCSFLIERSARFPQACTPSAQSRCEPRVISFLQASLPWSGDSLGARKNSSALCLVSADLQTPLKKVVWIYIQNLL